MTSLFGYFGNNVNNLIKQNVVAALNSPTIFKSSDGLLKITALNDVHGDVLKGSGMLLGKLFDKHTYKPIHSLDFSLTPYSLINSYWGRYAGALYDHSNKTLALIRDPLGLSTLFYFPVSGGIIFSTQLSTLYDFVYDKPHLDWHFFADYILEHHYISRRSPFKGIFELLPGMVLTVNHDGSMSEKFEWKLPFSKEIEHTLVEEEVFNALKASTIAWTTDAKKVTIELSGGVDSSSVLSMLKHCAPDIEVQAVHYNDSENVSSQEITYAQQVAAECGIPLHILDYQNYKILDALPVDWRPSKPNMFLTYFGLSDALHAHAANSLIMSGQGGDHVFLAPPPQESIADYILDKGIFGISNIFHELSGLYRTSWMQLSGKTITALKNYYGGYIPATKNTESPLNADLMIMLQKETCPLDEMLKNHSPGKAHQIKSLWHAIAYADRDQRFQDKVVTHPLLSLPVVECALRIPTYQSVQQGYNRYFLRKAVSRVTNTPVIWRRTKGRVTTSVFRAAISQFEELRALLVHGDIISSGIIDKAWVAKSCDQIRHGNSHNILQFLRLANCELWLKQWMH